MMPDGHFLRLKDVGRVELGSKNNDLDSEVDGKPSGSLAVFQLPDANALECADRVMAKMEELKKRFPDGLDYVVRYNTTPYIRESIWEVFNTLRDAVILVAIVVLLVLAELAVGGDSLDRRAGGDHRYVRRHAGDGLQHQ